MLISVLANVMLSPKNGCFIKRDVKMQHLGLSRIAFKHVSGVTFLSKIVFKRVMGWISGWSLPVQNFVGNTSETSIC